MDLSHASLTLAQEAASLCWGGGRKPVYMERVEAASQGP